MKIEEEVLKICRKCNRCGHVWVKRNLDQEPKVCPKCKSPYWNKPRTRGVKNNGIC